MQIIILAFFQFIKNYDWKILKWSLIHVKYIWIFASNENYVIELLNFASFNLKGSFIHDSLVLSCNELSETMGQINMHRTVLNTYTTTACPFLLKISYNPSWQVTFYRKLWILQWLLFFKVKYPSKTYLEAASISFKRLFVCSYLLN